MIGSGSPGYFHQKYKAQHESIFWNRCNTGSPCNLEVLNSSLYLKSCYTDPGTHLTVAFLHDFYPEIFNGFFFLQPASVQQIPIPIYAPLQGQHQAQLSLGAAPAVSQAQELFNSSLQPYR